MASETTTKVAASRNEGESGLGTATFVLLLFPCLAADLIGIIPFIGAIPKLLMNGVLLMIGVNKSASSGKNLGHVMNFGITAGLNTTPIPATTASLIWLFIKARLPAVPGIK